MNKRNPIIEVIEDICQKINNPIIQINKICSKETKNSKLTIKESFQVKFKRNNNLLMYMETYTEVEYPLMSVDQLKEYVLLEFWTTPGIQKTKSIKVTITEKNLNYIYDYIRFILECTEGKSNVDFDKLQDVEKDFFDIYGEIDKNGNITYERGNITPNEENKEKEKEIMNVNKESNVIKTIKVLCIKTLKVGENHTIYAGHFYNAQIDPTFDVVYVDHYTISIDRFLECFDVTINENGVIVPNEIIPNISKMICVETDEEKEIYKNKCYYVDFSKIFNKNEFKCSYSKNPLSVEETYECKLIPENIINHNLAKIISIEAAVKIIQENLDLKPSEILRYIDTVGDDMIYLKYQGDIITLDTNSVANPEYYLVFASIGTNDETHRFATRNVVLTNKSIEEFCDFITFLNPRQEQETTQNDTL